MSSPRNLFLAAAVAVIAVSVPSRAQAQTVVKCTIPFAFHVGAEEMPSGTYQLTTNAASGLLTVQNWAGKVGRYVFVQREDEPLGPETLVKFNRYGNTYFLSSVDIGDDGISLNLPRSMTERETAANNPKPQVTVVAANR